MKKLPDNARLMFEGVRYNIYQWEQTLFDGSTAIFEAAKRADSVTVIGTAGEMILVLQEEQPGQEPFLALPGGHCENMETPEKTARRKLLQEAGYKIHDIKNWFTAPYGWVLGDNYYFIARNVTVEGAAEQDPGDKITPKLISFDEFIEFRKNGMIRNKELLPIFERAANNEEEKNKLHDIIFGSPEELAAEEAAAKVALEEAAKKEQEDAEAELTAMKEAAQKEAEEKAAKIAALEAKAEEAKRKATILTAHEEAPPVSPVVAPLTQADKQTITQSSLVAGSINGVQLDTVTSPVDIQPEISEPVEVVDPQVAAAVVPEETVATPQVTMPQPEFDTNAVLQDSAEEAIAKTQETTVGQVVAQSGAVGAATPSAAFSFSAVSQVTEGVSPAAPVANSFVFTPPVAADVAVEETTSVTPNTTAV